MSQASAEPEPKQPSGSADQREQRHLAEQDVGDLRRVWPEHAQGRELAAALRERDARGVVSDAEGERAGEADEEARRRSAASRAIVSWNFLTAARRIVTRGDRRDALQLAEQRGIAARGRRADATALTLGRSRMSRLSASISM